MENHQLNEVVQNKTACVGLDFARPNCNIYWSGLHAENVAGGGQTESFQNVGGKMHMMYYLSKV